MITSLVITSLSCLYNGASKVPNSRKVGHTCFSYKESPLTVSKGLSNDQSNLRERCARALNLTGAFF